MFRSESESDHPSGNPSEEWKPCQQTDWEWRRKFVPIAQCTSNDSILNRDLHSLSHAGRPLAPLLDPLKILGCRPSNA